MSKWETPIDDFDAGVARAVKELGLDRARLRSGVMLKDATRGQLQQDMLNIIHEEVERRYGDLPSDQRDKIFALMTSGKDLSEEEFEAEWQRQGLPPHQSPRQKLQGPAR